MIVASLGCAVDAIIILVAMYEKLPIYVFMIGKYQLVTLYVAQAFALSCHLVHR